MRGRMSPHVHRDMKNTCNSAGKDSKKYSYLYFKACVGPCARFVARSSVKCEMDVHICLMYVRDDEWQNILLPAFFRNFPRTYLSPAGSSNVSLIGTCLASASLVKS